MQAGGVQQRVWSLASPFQLTCKWVDVDTPMEGAHGCGIGDVSDTIKGCEVGSGFTRL